MFRKRNVTNQSVIIVQTQVQMKDEDKKQSHHQSSWQEVKNFNWKAACIDDIDMEMKIKQKNQSTAIEENKEPVNSQTKLINQVNTVEIDLAKNKLIDQSVQLNQLNRDQKVVHQKQEQIDELMMSIRQSIEKKNKQNEDIVDLVIIEDSGNQLQYHKNLVLSSAHQSDQQSVDFEDQLIRRTVSKLNYQRLQKNKKVKKNNRLSYHLKRVSKQGILRRIKNQIDEKVTTKHQIVGELAHLQANTKELRANLQLKQQMEETVKNEYEKIKKALQYLYYRGDRVEVSKEISVQSLCALAQKDLALSRLGNKCLPASQQDSEIVIEQQYG